MNLSERRSVRGLLPALLATAALSAGGTAVLMHHQPVQAQSAVVRGLPDFTELVDMVGPSVVNIRTLERRDPSSGAGSPDEQMLEFFRRFGIPVPPGATPRQPRPEQIGRAHV